VPPELEADAPAVEVPAIPPQFASQLEPTLAVEVTPEKIYVSTHFLHGIWRDHLREEFETKRADKHWLAARQWSGELIERLDDTVPTWRSGRVEVADLENGRFTEKSLKGGSSAIVPPLFDVLIEQISVVRRVGAGLGIVRMMMEGPLEIYPSSLLLVVHPDVPPRTVQRVIYTASQVEIEHFQREREAVEAIQSSHRSVRRSVVRHHDTVGRAGLCGETTQARLRRRPPVHRREHRRHPAHCFINPASR
jgi:hypothetical protein